MRRTIESALLVLVFASTASCSLLIDTGPYLSGNDAGSRDGSADTGLPPDAPTAPVVRIVPENPTSADALTVEIVTESTDPLDAGPVTYEYRWTVDGADASIEVDTVPSDRTTRGEEWTVEVTPVAGGGARRGAPGTASVTIRNAPPEFTTVGLDSYRPIAGETLAAFAGPTRDPDGDPVSVRFAWFKNDEIIDGQTSNRLDTSRVTVAPGDRIRVEATAWDGEAGTTVSAGPAIVLADTTRWRQLLPHRVLPPWSFVAFDPVHYRVIYAYWEGEGGGVKVWEYALDRAVGGRFVQLFPSGTPPPLTLAIPVYDAAHRRILLFGAQEDLDSGVLTSDVYALDVSERGNEHWSVLAPAGAAPAPRLMPHVAYDEARRRVILYGGLDPTAGVAYGDVWVLDVSTEGEERWQELNVPTPPLPLGGASFAIDPEHDRAILAGGAELTDPSGEATASLAIYTLDLADPSTGFVATSTLPRSAVFATAGIDRAGGRMIVAYGVDLDGDNFRQDAIAIDLDLLSAVVVTPSGEGPPGGGSGLLVDDPHGDHLLFPGAPYFDAEAPFDLYAWSMEDDSVTPVHRTGVDLPPPLEHALAVGVFRIYGGVDNRNRVRAELWTMGSNARWTRSAPAPDPFSGRIPGPRAGIVLQANSAYHVDLQFFGGRTESGLADSTAWLLQGDGWIEQELHASSWQPEPREGAAFFVPACGSRHTAYFGGRDSWGTFLNDTAFLECLGGNRSCQWQDPVGTLNRPGPRAYAGAVRHDGVNSVVLYGGDGPEGAYDDVWVLDPCAGSAQPWERAFVSGTAPAARSRHTMTLVAASGAESESVLIVGGRSAGGEPLADVARLVLVDIGQYRWESVPVATGPNAEQLSPRWGHVATWDDRHRRLLVYGGRGVGDTLSDLWELRVRPPGG